MLMERASDLSEKLFGTKNIYKFDKLANMYTDPVKIIFLNSFLFPTNQIK